jgi:hypothetical protein
VNGQYKTWGAVAGPLPAGGSVTIGTSSVAWTPPASGTYSVSAVADDVNRFAESNESNNARTVSVAVAAPGAPPPAPSTGQDFSAMPAWHDTFDASWGSAASWSIASGGQSGTFLQASRASGGSSARALVFVVPSNAMVEVSAYLRGPAFAGTYWAEFGCRLGSHSADDFDANPGAWTMVQKFSSSGMNGNGNVWTRYAKSLSTGSSTVITVAFKLGSSGGPGPTVGWDSLRVSP